MAQTPSSGGADGAPGGTRDSEGGVRVDIEPLMTASRTLNAVVVRSLAAVDERVTVPQLRVLVILSDAGRSNLSGVAEHLGVNPSNASRTCDQLVKRALIDRVEDANDRRQVSLSLAPVGRELLSEVMHRRRALLEEMVGAMPSSAQSGLIRAVESFNVAAEQVRAGAQK